MTFPKDIKDDFVGKKTNTYPFTGNGFTPASDENRLGTPEVMVSDPPQVIDKAVIVRIDEDGTETIVGYNTTVTNEAGEEFDQFVYVNEKGEPIKPMNRFRNSINPVVKIGNRMFYYSVRNNVIRGSYLDLSSLGFKNIGKYFERSIKEGEIDSAYRVKWNYGVYKGFQVKVADYKEKEGEIFVMFDNDSDGEAAGIKPRIDYNDKCMRYYEAYVPESEVTDVYEVREAVEGFPFVSPEIVYHKKDGVWLPWHEYGTPLKDDEWI